MLSKVHQVEQQREGNLQAGGQQGREQAMGPTQEQAGHELRDHGQGTQVCSWNNFVSQQIPILLFYYQIIIFSI